MDEQFTHQLEEKVQILIDNYKEQKLRNDSLTKQVQELTQIKNNNTETIAELKSTIEKFENEIADKNDEITDLQQKLGSYQNVTKTATSQIDDILSQLSKL